MKKVQTHLSGLSAGDDASPDLATGERISRDAVPAGVKLMIAEGDTVATRLTFRGTLTGIFLSIPPTGKQVAVPALDMARFADGKLVEHWGGPDQMSLMQRLGVIPSMG